MLSSLTYLLSSVQVWLKMLHYLEQDSFDRVLEWEELEPRTPILFFLFEDSMYT